MTIPDLAALHALGPAQQPTYPDRGAVDAAVARLRTAPPLVLPTSTPSSLRFVMAAKLLAHCRQHTIGKIRITARAEAFVERGAKNRDWHGFVDSSRNRPASLS